MQRRGSSRTSSRSNRSKHRYSGTSEFLAHVQLDDDPRAPIQQSVREEFRQHDGVVTILMFYCRRASPKHRYNMTEVEYGGGGHRTRLRNDHEDQLVSIGCPLPPYIKDPRGGAGRPSPWRARRVLLPPGVGFPPNPSWTRTPQGGEGERGPATSPSPNRTRGRRGEARGHLGQ